MTTWQNMSMTVFIVGNTSMPDDEGGWRYNHGHWRRQWQRGQRRWRRAWTCLLDCQGNLRLVDFVTKETRFYSLLVYWVTFSRCPLEHTEDCSRTASSRGNGSTFPTYPASPHYTRMQKYWIRGYWLPLGKKPLSLDLASLRRNVQ